MEQQSGNNFDALFQKAAEDYPLKTDNGNWDIVAAKLRITTTASTAAKSGRWKYAAVILLLLSTGGFLYFYYNKPVNSSNQSAGNQSTIVSGKTFKQLNADKQVKVATTSKDFKNQSNTNITNNNLIKQSITNVLLNGVSKSNTTLFKQQNFTADNKISGKIIGLNDGAPAQSHTYISSVLPPQTSFSNTNKFENDNAINNKNSILLHNESAQTNEAKDNKPNNLTSAESQHIKLAPQPKLLYGELFIAPDFSTVKLQNVNAPGYNVGVAIGYRINKRFSAELGLERLHTDFYSNAKYLDKSHLKLKPNTTVQFVNGKSKLTEVPFNIKYDLSKKNNHFYVTMGTNIARITHTEKYNYQVIKDGTQHAASKHFGALTGTEFFSDLNFSAGYQTKLSGSFSLKTEPYYQVPLKGLGVGNLPVTNFGVSIGIIKDLK